MHPAPSIILFTALSGLGFGLMVWLGLMPGDKAPWVAATFCILALALAAIGLLSSLFHLGHPERAWKALSQWRSSWLSREGIAAIAALATFSVYALLWVTSGSPSSVLGILSALLAFATILCTAMIYTQMKTVPRWHTPATPALFLAYALTGGALLAGNTTAFLWLSAILTALQAFVWVHGDTAFARAGHTMNTATGLDPEARLRLLEAPHTSVNYLQKEMVFRIGRKHGRKLRVMALILLALVPLGLGLMFGIGHMLALPVLASHIAGLLIARWLFFAEAEHVVGLYYGQPTA
ncbi:dimethyl sulfoxide reductase anchor subunit family protein [Algicella marina]|uniref:Dibenzothiophene desulfurase n=1 Tax=Algicella marina TaxID=2683284 RepID=A0A6P1T530_9RHOB|nr:DmsC/YnfH family molybdoenzyme membrane anchor subunit [Algicella marina]QHQ37127.1 dibenzothiophene desulfurase [Algicella marina]